MPLLRDSLPPLYEPLLPPAFGREVPAERKATCEDCAMCQSAASPGASLFRPDTKCCTYHPKLPNYLVGALLADPDEALAEGRARVRARIASRVGVTPQGIGPPARYDLLYQSARGAFGRSPSLLCPYYAKEAGACTIWRYREGVCSTYFCKYVAGADGHKLWTSVKTYLALCERQLSRWALLQLAPDLVYASLDAPARASGTLELEDVEGAAPKEADYAAAWQGFAGREEALYVGCYEQVRGLSAADLERLLGLEGQLQLGALERRYEAALRPRLPQRPRLNPAATLKHLPDGTVGVGAYSDNDALALPAEAFALLLEFRGQEPLEDVRRRLRETRGADFDDELLVILHQHRVLID